MKATPKQWADHEKAAFPVLRDMLLLVDRRLPRASFRAWTANQRKAAETWAALTHLSASDNPVKVPPMPACVKRLALVSHVKARARRPARHPRRDVPTSAQHQPGRCRVCSCTDAHACPGGCSWADETRTLCSACTTPPEPRRAA